MGYIKYGIYLVVVIIIALIFEQIMTLFYNLTIQGIQGDFYTYIILGVIWFSIFLLAKIFLNENFHPKSSIYAMVGGMIHIGGCLAAYFMETNPILLLVFPVIFIIFYTNKTKKQGVNKGLFKLKPIHPLFVDTRGNICVLRSTAGFTALKFFTITPPFPVKELLLYLFHEQIEWTFEIQSKGKKMYYLTIIVHGRNYDTVHQQCLDKITKLRHFLRQEEVTFIDLDDVLNALSSYYAPYFIYPLSSLDAKGIPNEFPRFKNIERELVIEYEMDELTFSLHNLQLDFKSNEFYAFLDSLEEYYYLQIHMRPLSLEEVASRAAKLNREYRDSIQRLTNGLEKNTEFQAASYLFSQVGDAQKKNLELLLDKNEIMHLRAVRRKIQQIEEGKVVGVWHAEVNLIGNQVLAQNLAIKSGGTQQLISPQIFPVIASRQLIGYGEVVDSKELYHILPNRIKQREVMALNTTPIPTTIEEDL
ncbi:MAG: hypothetical protein ACTSRC_09425 [Candidatus Helarchaeota archaeon]